MDLKQAYERWIGELWNGDLTVADELVTDDFLIHQARADGQPSEDERGPAALRALVEQGRAPFSEITFSVEAGPIAEGPSLACRWRAIGTYAGGIPGASAEPGTDVSFGGIDLLRAAPDGRFAEYWVSSDGLSLMQQLGAA